MTHAKSILATAVMAACSLPLAATAQSGTGTAGSPATGSAQERAGTPHVERTETLRHGDTTTTPGVRGTADSDATPGVPGAPRVPGTPAASGTIESPATVGTQDAQPASTTQGTGTPGAVGSPGVTGAAGTTFDDRRGPTGTLGANPPTTGTTTGTGDAAGTRLAPRSDAAASSAAERADTAGQWGVLGQQRQGMQQRRAGWIPGTYNGYVGANIGWTRWGSPAVISGFAADRRTTGGKIYGGGMFSPNFGAELGYVHFGSVDRAGGRDRAQGINLSLVGSMPIHPVNVFAKLGTTYGFTRTNAAPAAGIATGRERGFGLAYGVGLGFELTPTWQLVAEWERHRLRFAPGRESINMVSIGARMMF